MKKKKTTTAGATTKKPKKRVKKKLTLQKQIAIADEGICALHQNVGTAFRKIATLERHQEVTERHHTEYTTQLTHLFKRLSKAEGQLCDLANKLDEQVRRWTTWYSDIDAEFRQVRYRDSALSSDLKAFKGSNGKVEYLMEQVAALIDGAKRRDERTTKLEALMSLRLPDAPVQRFDVNA